MRKEQILNELFHKTMVALRTMGFRESSIADFTFTFLFWKYLSDTKGDKKYIYPGEEFDFNLINTQASNKNLRDAITHSLNRWTAKNGFERIMEVDFNSVNLQLLPSIFYYWKSTFDELGANFWTNGNIKLAHDLLNECLSSEFKDAHLLFTPLEIQKLLTSLAEKQKHARLYDPFCRSGGMLFELGEEIDSPTVMEGVTAELVSYKAAKTYSLMMNGNSSITIESFGQLLDRAKIFDIVITNPPFGHLLGDHSANEKYWSVTFPSKRSEIRYLTHCLDHLSEKGQAYIILPRGFLTWSDRLVVALRKELIERNIIEGVVELPQKVFFGTGTATAVLLLNKQKRSKKIILINAGHFGTKERDRVKFSFETIELIKTWLQKFRNGKISELPEREVQVFSAKEMMQQDYSLGFKATPNNKRERPSSESVMLECAELQFKISKIQKQIQDLQKNL